MPSLLDLQRALHGAIVAGNDATAANYLLGDSGTRVEIYRNTRSTSLVRALRLNYPVVDRLVGPDFFEATARAFITRCPPTSACLDDYGAAFPAFLANFPPARGLCYLPGVARLEWAVSRALHAEDIAPLDLGRLAAGDPADHGRIVLRPHPSIGLVRADEPVDVIWRAVLLRDDARIAAIDIGAGPVWLLVERLHHGIEVTRLSESEWRFASALFGCAPLQSALAAVPEIAQAPLLAGHLAAGRFVEFSLVNPGAET